MGHRLCPAEVLRRILSPQLPHIPPCPHSRKTALASSLQQMQQRGRPEVEEEEEVDLVDEAGETDAARAAALAATGADPPGRFWRRTPDAAVVGGPPWRGGRPTDGKVAEEDGVERGEGTNVRALAELGRGGRPPSDPPATPPAFSADAERAGSCGTDGCCAAEARSFSASFFAKAREICSSSLTVGLRKREPLTTTTRNLGGGREGPTKGLTPAVSALPLPNPSSPALPPAPSCIARKEVGVGQPHTSANSSRNCAYAGPPP